MIVSNLLIQAVDFLGKDKSIDAEVLLCFTLGVDKVHLMINQNMEVDDDLSQLFWVYLKMAKKGEPIAYLLNEKEFYNLDFYVNKNVLVPRPETEQIVDLAIEYLVQNSAGRRQMTVLDVGTGSCNIPVAIAKNTIKYPIIIDACDISYEALEVARINIDQHCVEDRVEIFQSDLLDNVENQDKYDVITANLPYIGKVTNKFVDHNVDKFEPGLALYGGDTGLELYEKMFEQIRDKGIEYGIILGEFGFGQGEEMGELLNKFYKGKWEIVKDLAGIERIFVVKK